MHGGLYHRLSILQRITIVLCAIVVVNWILQIATDYAIIGGDLLNFFFVIAVVLLGGSFLKKVTPRLMRYLNRMVQDFVTTLLARKI